MADVLKKLGGKALLFLFERDLNFATLLLFGWTAVAGFTGHFWASVGLGLLTIAASFITAKRVEE